MNIRFGAMPVAFNPSLKNMVVRNRLGETVIYNQCNIRTTPVAVLSDASGRLVDIVDIYQKKGQWMTNQLTPVGAQG